MKNWKCIKAKMFISLVSWARTERTDSHPFPHPSKLLLSFPCLDGYPQCPFGDIPMLLFPSAAILWALCIVSLMFLKCKDVPAAVFLLLLLVLMPTYFHYVTV